MLRYFSMFTGIGGFELGIQRAALSVRDGEAEASKPNPLKPGVEPASESLQPHGNQPNNISTGDPREVLCVGYSEIDKYAIKVYERHFNGHKNYGDATKINPSELPDFELLVGGFPCQAFSVAGKRRGFEEARGTLFFDVARILADKRPRHLVLENVKGLLSHDGGKTFATIIGILTDMGYLVEWQVLNSKNHGVPQNRERVIIVGHLGGDCGSQIFPLRQAIENGAEVQSNIKGSVSGTLTARQYANWSGNHVAQLNQPVHSNDRVYSPEGISPTLNTMQGGRRQPLVALSRNESAGHTETDTAGVREASGLPRPVDAMSDTQRYKMAGNAVTTNVIEDVMEALFNHEI